MFGFGSGSVKKKDLKSCPEVQPDRLRADALASAEHALLFASGIPGTADALAYEQVQGLVAISTSDGKVKLLGRPGCEATVYSAAKDPYATRQLQFLQNRGILVRVSKGGFMESWSVASSSGSEGCVRSLGTVKVQGDKICCVADMARDPYVLLGCSSGSLRIATLVDDFGSPPKHPREARGFTIAPYRVRPHAMCGEGEVRQLAVQSIGPIHRALVLFTVGMVAVWDLRAVELTTSINPRGDDAAEHAPALVEAGEATAVCWIGTDRGDFATGHVDGSVLVWDLPGLQPGRAAVAAVMRVVRGTAEPVRMIRCVLGEVDGLLVLGGQEVEQPEGLTWLALPGGAGEPCMQEESLQAEDEEVDSRDQSNELQNDDEDGGEVAGVTGPQSARSRGEGVLAAGPQSARSRGRAVSRRHPNHDPVKLPWFGHLISFALVVDGGYVTGYEAPSAVLQLVEGGQLVLHRLADHQPHMVASAFQQRTPIICTEAPLVPVNRPAACSPNAITLATLRKLAAEAEARGQHQPGGAAVDLSAFTCGTPPPLPSDASWGLVYCTGYKDGGVCLWDLHGGTTQLLCSAPSGDAVAELRRSSTINDSVTCLSLVWPTGLVLCGHQHGEVRMYQFSSVERQVDCITLESINTTGTSRSLLQPAGLQLRLRVKVSSGEVTSLAYCQAIRAVAVGDKAGGVALVDTSRPVVRWYAMPAQNAVLSCALAPLPLPPARLRVPEVAGEEGAPSHAVIIADSEGSLAALDAARGCFIGRNGELTPKNQSCTLMLELLDEGFTPLWACRQMGAGCEQATLGGCGSGKTGAPGGSQPLPRRSGDDGEQRGRLGGSGRGRAEGDSDEEWRNGGLGSGSEGEDVSDMDAETLLARAAMQVHGSRRTPTQDRSRGPATRAREHSRRGGGPASNELEADAGGSAAVMTSCPDPTAHYMLLVTEQYLRIYSAANVMSGERSTLAKRCPGAHQHLVYARPVQVAGAPGVMALATTERGLCTQVYSLPSLNLLHEAPLSASLALFWDVPTGHEWRLDRLAATSRLGHLLLLGLSNELLTLGLTAGLHKPAPPLTMFDPAAASASLAASTTFEVEHQLTSFGRLIRRRDSVIPVQGQTGATSSEGPATSGPSAISVSDTCTEGIDAIARTEGRRLEKGPSAAAAALTAPLLKGPAVAAAAERVAGAAKEANVTLTRVFHRVQQGLSRAVEETTRGVRQLATNVDRGVVTRMDGAGTLSAGPGAEGQARSVAAGRDPRDAEWHASLPDLGDIFSRAVLVEDGERHEGEDRREGVGRAPRRPGEQQPPGAAGGNAVDDDDDDDDVSILTISDGEDEVEGVRAPPRPPLPPRPAPQPSAANPGPAMGWPRMYSHAQPPPQPPLPPPRSTVRSIGGEESSLRSELFAGARLYASAGGGAAAYSIAPSRPGPSGVSQPRARTAEEIKRAYGRQPPAASPRANDMREVMEQNRGKLEERGEKLRQLNDKAADLENSAAGFAEMARQLAERERNKKWWQL